MHDKQNNRTEPVTSLRLRHARMKIETAVLMSRGGDAYSSEVADISATGVLVQRPQGWKGEPGELWVLDMLVGDDLNIHVEATVARATAHHVGFAYARIPDEKQAALWNLLGGYADTLEPLDDE
nr:PilZ domain-containing protein [Mizugakiibacter sediminis]